jgi:branched-chain amino acid transport system permease protein
MVIFSYVIKRTSLGKAMRACEQNLNAARLIGIDINRTFRLTCAIGAALAAAAGTLVGPIFFVSPAMGLMVIAKVFAVVILGGMGNVAGAIWAAFILGLTESMTAGFLSSDYKDVVTFLILIIVLAFKPEGLFGRNQLEKV